jgi:hypothetical protein
VPIFTMRPYGTRVSMRCWCYIPNVPTGHKRTLCHLRALLFSASLCMEIPFFDIFNKMKSLLTAIVLFFTVVNHVNGQQPSDQLTVTPVADRKNTLRLLFETSRFDDDISNIQFWYKKTTLLVYESRDGLKDSIDAIGASHGLANHIDKDLHNNYSNLRYDQKIPFGDKSYTNTIILKKVEKISEGRYAIEVHITKRAGNFTFRGQLISAITRDPIPNASIMVTKSSGVKTDSVGKFTIKGLKNGSHNLSFSALGYRATDTTITLLRDVENFKWIIRTTCRKYNNQAALNDIKAGKPVILLQSGEGAMPLKSDALFAEKYGITFLELGTTEVDQLDCIIDYNRTIFSYLDKKFGNTWRAEIRKDIIGLRSSPSH